MSSAGSPAVGIPSSLPLTGAFGGAAGPSSTLSASAASSQNGGVSTAVPPIDAAHIFGAIADNYQHLITIAALSFFGYRVCVRFIPRVMEVLFSRGLYGIDINKNTPEQRAAFGALKRSVAAAAAAGPAPAAANNKKGGNDKSPEESRLRESAVPESLGIIVGGVYLCVVALILISQGAVASLHHHHRTYAASSAALDSGDWSAEGLLTAFTGYFLSTPAGADSAPPSQQQHATTVFSEGVGSEAATVPLGKANAAINSIAVMLLLGFVDDVLDVRWKYKIILSLFGVVSLLLAYDGPLFVMVPLPVRELLGGAHLLYLGPLYLCYMGLFCVFCTNSINILAGINGVEVGQSIVIAVASIVHNLVQLRQPDFAPQHLLCIALLVPFVGVSLALYKFNKYPSRVFVGDSYTYFAGMTLAVAGITGAYTKTLMLFFLPQLFNFIISLPQLFHIVPCPRHRVPNWDPKRDVLMNSKNYTILNAILVVTGDVHERTLTRIVLGLQVASCLLGFFVRYGLAWYFFDIVI